MSRYVAAGADYGEGWFERLAHPERVTVSLECDGCGETLSRGCRPEEVDDQVEALEFGAWCGRWRVGKALVACQGPRDYCPACAAKLTPGPGRDGDRPGTWSLGSRHRTIPRGFTLVELLVVLLIVAIIAAVALPVVATSWSTRRIDSAAQLLQGEITAAVARAQRDGFAGIRLIPDPAFPVKRLADGSVDPSTPLAYSRVVPLTRPDVIADGLVTIRDTHPAGFPTAALILEQEVTRDEGGVRVLNEPTSWAWRVRVGDLLELAGRTYTVCGPVAEANPEGFVNYPGGSTGLDRGDGPAEWLALVNGVDDDGDGSIDNGWNGLDENGDGVVDDPLEWTETEAWGLGAPVIAARYRIRPRPVQAAGSTGVDLVGALIDATGWDAASPRRSRLPVDRLSGGVDLTVRPDGRVEPSSRHAPTVPAVGGLARPFLHFWISNRESVDATAPDVGRLVTVHARTGLVASGEADPADVEESYRKTEGGGE